MTGIIASTLVPPLAPPPRSDGRRASCSTARGPLPLAPLVSRRARSTVYGLAAVDDRGRIADARIVRALGWHAETCLDIRVACGLIVVTVSVAGRSTLTIHGYLRLPATVRRAVGIWPGDRVLLTAEPADGALVVHPHSVLDTMLSRSIDMLIAGDGS